MIAIAVVATATVAGGSMLMRKHKQAMAAKKLRAYQQQASRYRNAYRSVRTPSYAHITSDDVQYHGNRNLRDVMMRNAKYRFNNIFAYRSSIWDLERFLK